MDKTQYGKNMKIQLDEAIRITEKYGTDDVPLVFLNDMFINTGAGMLQLSQGMKFDVTQADLMMNANIKEFEVVFTEKILAKLITNYPERYRYPLGRKDFMDIDRLIDTLDAANRMTKRKRHVISSTEIYKKNSSGMYETTLRYGERLTYSRWNQIKSRLGRNSSIDYRLDEVGVIVFIIMRPGEPHYMQKFMNNTELISLIVEHKDEFDVTIAPDFNPNTDIYPVNTKAELLQTYIDQKPRLIIIGDELNDEYKAALAQIKHFDRYARLMVVKNPSPSQKKEILDTIKKVYNQNLWD